MTDFKAPPRTDTQNSQVKYDPLNVPVSEDAAGDKDKTSIHLGCQTACVILHTYFHATGSVTYTVWSENDNTSETLHSKLGQSYNGLCTAQDFKKNENTEKQLQQDNSYIQ